MTAATAPIASYARRSKRATGDGKGAFINIADQHAQNRAYAAEEFPGAPVVEYDDNMSAWNPDVTREDWERLLDDTRAGKLRAVIGRYADRLTRQPEQGEALLSACRKSRAELHTTSGGHITSALMFRIELALAAEESDQKSRRMTDKHRVLGTAGAYSGGRRRFGFTDKMAGVVPAEAAAIMDAMARVLNGESLASIARLWNKAGLRSPEGNEFTTRTVSALLRGRHLAKIRPYAGQEIAASWAAPAIVDATTHAAVIRRLSKNNADRQSPLHAGRVHKFSGLPLCGECGYPLYGKPSKSKSGPAYSCRNPRRTAPHGQAPTADVDAVIRAAVVARLTRVDAAGVFVVEADAEAAQARQAERETLVTRRDEELPDAAALGDYTPAQVRRLTATINARLAELDAADDAEAEAVSRPRRVLSGLVGLTRDQAAAAFDALPLDSRRAVVAELGTPVLVGRNTRKGVFNPRRVQIVWHDDGRVT